MSWAVVREIQKFFVSKSFSQKLVSCRLQYRMSIIFWRLLWYFVYFIRLTITNPISSNENYLHNPKQISAPSAAQLASPSESCPGFDSQKAKFFQNYDETAKPEMCCFKRNDYLGFEISAGCWPHSKQTSHHTEISHFLSCSCFVEARFEWICESKSDFITVIHENAEFVDGFVGNLRIHLSVTSGEFQNDFLIFQRSSLRSPRSIITMPSHSVCASVFGWFSQLTNLC